MDDMPAQGPKDEPTPKPQPTGVPSPQQQQKFMRRLIKVIRPFGGWMRDPCNGSRRIVFSKSDVLTAAIIGYETIGGIETAKLFVLGPPPGIPILAWGVPVCHFMLMDAGT